MRTVDIWVSEPTGGARPLRMASTPEMKVVPTAPMPGSSTPSLPVAGAMSTSLSCATKGLRAVRSGDPEARSRSRRGGLPAAAEAASEKPGRLGVELRPEGERLGLEPLPLVGHQHRDHRLELERV